MKPYTVASGNIKYLGIILSKNVQVFYTENDTIFRDIKGDLQNVRITHS